MTEKATGAVTGYGIDIGGSGVKGARVDLTTGEFASDRIRIATPKPATPDAVAEVVAEILRRDNWEGPVGITVPAVVKDQVARSAANIDKSWIDTDVAELFHRHLGTDRTISVLNDADAAGLAEVAFGDPAMRRGPVIFLTLGTGIGSAFILDGALFPNTEIGHMIVGEKEAEHQAASSVKEKKGWSYEKWTKKLSTVLAEYEKLFHPSLFVIGGGISKNADEWIPLLRIDTPVVPAKLRNRAGIVGAAMAAQAGLTP